MNTLKLILILALILVGLVNRRHAKPIDHTPPRVTAAQSAVNQEILQNAERLTQTLRQCKQTAHSNNETK